MFNFNPLKEGRVLVPNYQHRLFLAISAFVGMLLLVGWVAINEPARMEVFTQQYAGRSIENGATIFLNNCATCHGVDGKGQAGRAPALNNPMLFLKDNPIKAAQVQIDDLTKQQGDLQTQIDQYNANIKRLTEVKAEIEKPTATSDVEKLKTEQTSLESKISSFDLAKVQGQANDLGGQIKTIQASMEKLKGLGWEAGRDTRLTEVKWNGTLAGYLESTVISGRPVSSLYWPQPMPAWGREAGGPLRPDEIRNVVDYILNFRDTAINLTPKDLAQQFKNPTSGAAVAAGKTPVGKDADIKKLLAAGSLKPGDAAAGEALYTSAGCAGCHANGSAGPVTAGTYTRVVNERLKAPENAGKTPEEYLAESIIHPGAYVSPNFADGVMPQDWGTKLDITDIQNLIAYLENQK